MPVGLAPAPSIVWFRGPDAVRFLNDLISQEIADLDPGTVTQSLLLSPTGRIEFILWVMRGVDEVGLITEDGRHDELIAMLARYRIRVEVEIRADDRPAYLVVGEAHVEPGTWTQSDGVTVDLSWPSTQRTLLVAKPKPDLPRLTEEQVDALRIVNGIPLVGVDLDEKTIPQEAGLVPTTVSFTKGCFLGQELVARLDSRGGRVNRLLRRLEFESSVPVGTRLIADGKEVGTATTVSGRQGMALLQRRVEPGDRLLAGGQEATVVDIPQKTAGSFTTS